MFGVKDGTTVTVALNWHLVTTDLVQCGSYLPLMNKRHHLGDEYKSSYLKILAI